MSTSPECAGPECAGPECAGPEISVIIPVYNMERLLSACLDSLLAQEERDWEGILVDDGSTDSSAETCRRYVAADPRFRLLSRPNGGLSAARNTGLDAARGRYLCFLDSDDLLHPRCLSTLLGNIRRDRADISSCSFAPFSDTSTDPVARITASLPSSSSAGNKVLGAEEAVEGMLYQTSPLSTSACGKLFRRELWGELRFRPGILYEDLDLIYRALLRADRVSISPLPLYLYRSTPGSITHTLTPNRADVLDVTARLLREFSAGEPNSPHSSHTSNSSLSSHSSNSSLSPLLRAAADRRLSACFNMLSLIDLNPGFIPGRREECLEGIRSLWPGSLFNPRVRLKNKLGILLWLLSFGQCFRILRILRHLRRPLHRLSGRRQPQ